MNGLRPLAVALLCCLWLVSGVPVAADGGGQAATAEHGGSNVVSGGNTTEYLTIPDDRIDRSTTTEADLDVAAAVGSRTASIHVHWTEFSLQQSIRNADNETERREAVAKAAALIDARIDRLEARERRAVTNYAAGGSSDAQFVRALAVVDAEARETDDAVGVLHRENGRLDDPVLTNEEIAAYRARLLLLYGPVRQQLGETATTGDGVRVYVETGGTDTVLATVEDPELDDQQYVREASARNARGAAEPSDFDAEDVERRFSELYPWTNENQDGGFQIGRFGGEPHVFTRAGVWPLDVGHAHAARTPGLVTFFDGSSEDVFREFQYTDPSRVPTTTVENTTAGGELRLVVETTRPGGPLGVGVVDNATDERVDAAVEINGETLGSTGGDRLWTVGPRGDLTVNATHDGQRISVETRLD